MTVDAHSIARDLAARHPDTPLPCPVCAAAVKARNLDRHLASVHPDRTSGTGRLAWSGPERMVLRPLAILPILFVAGVVAWSWRSGRELRPWFLAATVVLLGFLLLAGLAVADVRLFLGRLSVRGRQVRLRHTLMLLTRTLSTVDRVDFGPAYRMVSAGTSSASTDPSIGDAGTEQRAGACLRVFAGRRSITIHCRQGTGLRKNWTGWRQGRRRRRWHITLSAGDFVGLQYALADLGLLQLRSG